MSLSDLACQEAESSVRLCTMNQMRWNEIMKDTFPAGWLGTLER